MLILRCWDAWRTDDRDSALVTSVCQLFARQISEIWYQESRSDDRYIAAVKLEQLYRIRKQFVTIQKPTQQHQAIWASCHILESDSRLFYCYAWFSLIIFQNQLLMIISWAYWFLTAKVSSSTSYHLGLSVCLSTKLKLSFKRFTS